MAERINLTIMDEVNLKEIIDRLEKLENSVFGSAVNHLEITGKTGRQGVKNKKERNEDLIAPIRKLCDGGFFNIPKIDLEVLSELQKKLLTKKKPLRASLVNVLRKMTRKEVLERVEIVKGKKKLIAYQNKK